MSESLKFGPQWLRKSLSNSPPKEEEVRSSVTMAEYRYGKEEMLGIFDGKIIPRIPEILPLYKRLYVHTIHVPMALEVDEKQPIPQTRTFINSNIKHGSNNWKKSPNDEPDENWRFPSANGSSIKEHKEPSSSFYTKSEKYPPSDRCIKKNWRDKSDDEDKGNFSYAAQLTKEDEESTLQQQQQIVHKKSPEVPLQVASTSKQVSSPYSVVEELRKTEMIQRKLRAELLERTTKKEVKNLWLTNPEEEKVKKLPNSDESKACELNMKKLEKDLLLNLSDLAIDREKKENGENNKPFLNIMTWFYIDPNGKVQGPFTDEEMSLWYNHGFFYDTLMLRRSIDKEFISLVQLIHAFGSAQPFEIASIGLPIPKPDNQLEKIKQLRYKVMQQSASFLQSNQWNDTVAYPESSNQYPVKIQQYYNNENNPHLYQQIIQASLPQQQNAAQIDPRLLNMNNGNAHVQNYNNMNPLNYQNRPIQMPPHLVSQPIVKTPMVVPAVNQYSQQMVHQMPNTLPPEHIQKILYELQKKKILEQQRQAMYYQQYQICRNNTMTAPINDQNQVTIKQVETNHQNQNALQNFFNSHNISANPPQVMTSMPRVENTNNLRHTEVQEQRNNVQMNFDADDEGEFRLVGNVKRKKFQKETPEKQQEKKFTEDYHSQQFFNSKPLPRPQNDSNKSHEIQPSEPINVAKKATEERSKHPALPAPWKDKVKVDRTASENLKRIQIEEEELRQIKREMELEKLKKEQEAKEKVNHLTWNTILSDKLEEEKAASDANKNSIWDASLQNKFPSKNANKKSRQSKSKQLYGIKKEDPVLSVNVEKENEFKNWCIDMLSKMNTKIDIPVFVNFLAGLESPFEIEDYVKMYLGDSIENTLFTRKFLERRSLYRKATKIVEIDDDLCAPPKAINPGSHEETHKTHKRIRNNNQKKGKKTFKAADKNILGFKGTAASNRIVGELNEMEY